MTKIKSVLKKFNLKLGNYITLFWCCFITLRNYVIADFKPNHTHELISLVTVYVSMMLIWLLVFSSLQPIRRENSFYKSSTLIKIFTYCVLLIAPFLLLSYKVETYFSKNQKIIDPEEFYELFALRIIFEFGLALTFKYLIDSLEVSKNYIEQAHKLQEANTKAQFEILKQQINPHFLFNSLSTLKSLIRINDPNAEEFVMSLSEVYRKLLQRREKELIRLGDEIDIVKSYLFMQKLRFENNLIVENSVQEAYLQSFIPPFALQLLIENTIKHNVISHRKPLTIRIYINNSNQIVVENNVQPKKTTEESTGWGLSSLMEHYTAFTQTPVEIKETDSVFSVALPLLTD